MSSEEHKETERSGTKFLEEVVAWLEGRTPSGPKVLKLLPPDLVQVIYDAAVNFGFDNEEDGEIAMKTYAWLGRDAGIDLEFTKGAEFHRKSGKTDGCIVYIYPDKNFTDEQKFEIRKREIPLLEGANFSVKNQHFNETLNRIAYGDLVRFVDRYDPKQRKDKVKELESVLKRVKEILGEDASEGK